MRTRVFLAVFALAACGDDDGVMHIDSGLDASDDDATVSVPGVDAGRDASFEGTFQCDLDAGASGGTPDGWFATKTVLDVWWQGQPLRDPGRGEIEIDTLSHVDDAGTTIKVCGITLPPYTSDGYCNAYQLTIPDEVWESPSMPRFTVRSIDGVDAGDVTVNAATALIGIDFLNGQEDRVWPTSMMTGRIACEAGIGGACYPDHDNDSFDGITARYRIDGATYVGPYDNGLCTNGAAYTFAGARTAPDFGDLSSELRAERIRLGMRTRLLAPGASDRDCTANFDLRAYDCAVDPTTLPSGVTRPASGTHPENACTDAEAQLIDDSIPAYRVLAVGEAPGDSMPPLGWILNNRDRDIDKQPSEGPRSAFVRLADLADTEPTCAQVRAATFPTL